MEKMATEGSVWIACDRLVSEGRKVTGRAVLTEVGGSLSTVLRYIDSWKKRDIKTTTVAAEIPGDLQDVIRRTLGQVAQDATENLTQQLQEMASRETESLEALEKYEQQIADLNKELESAKTHIVELRQSNEKSEAVAVESIASLREQVAKLEQENTLLIRSGESARTETAKAMMQVERADQAAHKADERVVDLEKKLDELNILKTDAEKGRAVAEQHANGLVEQAGKLETLLTKCNDKISNLESEKTTLTRELKVSESARQKSEGVGEQMEIRLKEGAVTIDHLRKELESCHSKQISGEK